MNESKFQYNVNKNSIEYCDNHFAYCNGEEYKIVKKLNNLMRENEQLKEDNMLLIEDSEKYRKLSIQFDNRNKELISENEQLKSICKDHRDHAIDFKADCVRLEKENEELKKENEKWKSIACDNSSFNSILLHELDIAKEQGYTVSDPFKKLMGKCE